METRKKVWETSLSDSSIRMAVLNGKVHYYNYYNVINNKLVGIACSKGNLHCLILLLGHHCIPLILLTIITISYI